MKKFAEREIDVALNVTIFGDTKEEADVQLENIRHELGENSNFYGAEGEVLATIYIEEDEDEDIVFVLPTVTFSVAKYEVEHLLGVR